MKSMTLPQLAGPVRGGSGGIFPTGARTKGGSEDDACAGGGSISAGAAPFVLAGGDAEGDGELQP